MTVASPWCFPDLRTVASWRRAHPSAAAWLACLRIQHVEALVDCADILPLGPVERAVLAVFSTQASSTRAEVDDKLHLGPTLLAQVLRRLVESDLIVSNDQDKLSLTALGREACVQGNHRRRERRRFAFVDRPAQAPHYLALRAEAGLPAAAAPFDPAQLAHCIRQPVEWKQRHGFPTEATGVVRDGPRAFVLVYACDLPVFLQDQGDGLTAHSFTADGALGSVPVFQLERNWREVLPQLEQTWSVEHARAGWDDWRQTVGMQDLAAEVSLSAGKLVVRSPDADKVRTHLDGCPWALVGADNIRQLMPLEVLPS